MVYLHTCTMGVHPACLFIVRAGKVATPERNLAGKHSSHLVYLSLLSRTNWRAPGIFWGIGYVAHYGATPVLQPIMPLDLPVKVRSWELTVYPHSHIRRWLGVTRPAQARM